MKFDKGLIAGSSTLLVLTLLESGDMYGYQMIEELSRRSNDAFQFQEGTLYPILHGLEKGKYLSGYQQQAPSGRMRKYYRLTRKGRELLAEKKAEWASFHRGVADVLSGTWRTRRRTWPASSRIWSGRRRKSGRWSRWGTRRKSGGRWPGSTGHGWAGCGG